MGKPLRVLIVEDSEDDTLLITRELQRNGYNPIVELVDTPAAMTAALDKQKWDIVIADYVLPHFSGLDALKLLQKKGLDLPFIIVSGKIGEDTAVAAMKAGAHDYIMKDNLMRLTTTIEREVRESKTRQKRKRLEEMIEERTKELQNAEEKLANKRKLSILGQLAGGVAHELRNPLGAIKNAAYFLNAALEEPEPEVKETLEILEKEVVRSEHIIRSLLGFASPKPPIRHKVNINAIIQTALSRTVLPENVEVVSQLDETLPNILADPDQLDQVLGNIILNAIQAMPEGGHLVVKSEVPSPEWVAVSIADTGAGIPEENLTEIFEPIFSTKARGIGLGLSLVKTLVEGHRGSIEVESEMGKGSTFTVRLPVNSEEEK